MGQTRKVSGRATAVFTDEDGTHVLYHSTKVVTLHKDGSVTLRTGGWMTNTTKTRMNQAAHQFDLGYQVHQRNFGWFIQLGNLEVPFVGNEIKIAAEMLHAA